MSKSSLYMLNWSEEHQRYEFTASGHFQQSFTQADEQAWLVWVEEHVSFAFEGHSGHLSLVKEARTPSAGYWYAYSRQAQHTRKRYLGRSSALTFARLEEIALSLAKQHTSASTRSSPSLTPSTSPTLQLLTKFLPPRLPALLVERPRLLALLDKGLGQKLTLVQAPAGFGKTTLVAQWISQRQNQSATTPTNPAPVAWLSLEQTDNDPIRFWYSILSACQTFQEQLGYAANAHLSQDSSLSDETPSLENVLTVLLNDLSQMKKSAVLVLEDYHLIGQSRIHESVAFFVDHLPASLQLVILTRAEPSFPLVRWRARGDVLDVTHSHLRFSEQETAIFLQHLISQAISPEAIHALHIHLEGWPAGLRLLVLDLQGLRTSQEIEELLMHLSTANTADLVHRSIDTFFLNEVLAAQSERLQHFLLQTSILSRLTAALCNTMTGREDGDELLAAVERAGLFLEVLERSGQAEPWYRYHALFADALHREALLHLGAERLCTLAQSASRWYEQHDMLAEAVDTALRAQEFDRAALLIEHIYETASFYQMHTLRHWLRQIPTEVLAQHPELYFHEARTLLSNSGENEAIPLKTGLLHERLQLAEDEWRARENPARLGEVFASRALVIWRRGEIKHAGTYARQAPDLLPGTSRDQQERTYQQAGAEKLEWRSICLAVIGAEIIGEGNLDEARQALQEARACSNFPNITRVATMMLGLCLPDAGRALPGSRIYPTGADRVLGRAGLGRYDLCVAWIAGHRVRTQ